MVEVVRSSFIPKKEIQKSSKKRFGGSGVNIFFLVSLVVFLTTVVASAGVYFWKEQLEKSIKTDKEIFKKLEEFNTIESFKELFQFNKKLKVSNELLNKHYYVVPILDFIEAKTIPTIYFTEMEMLEDGDYIVMNFKGVANDFSDIVQQKDKYTQQRDKNGRLTGGNPNIEDFVFLNITKDKGGDIVFDMSFKVNKKYLTKEKLF